MWGRRHSSSSVGAVAWRKSLRGCSIPSPFLSLLSPSIQPMMDKPGKKWLSGDSFRHSDIKAENFLQIARISVHDVIVAMSSWRCFSKQNTWSSTVRSFNIPKLARISYDEPAKREIHARIHTVPSLERIQTKQLSSAR